jgi:hypothetical protein
MTMYLPNPDVHPVGYEAAEFIEPPTSLQDGLAHHTPRERGSMRLDVQTRVNITRWAEEYISGLVENHHGDPEDVRSIIDDLYRRPPFPGGSPLR